MSILNAEGVSYRDLDARYLTQALFDWMMDARVVQALSQTGKSTPAQVRQIQQRLGASIATGTPLPAPLIESAARDILGNKKCRHAAARAALLHLQEEHETTMDAWVVAVRAWAQIPEDDLPGPKPIRPLKPSLKTALRLMKGLRDDLRAEADDAEIHSHLQGASPGAGGRLDDSLECPEGHVAHTWDVLDTESDQTIARGSDVTLAIKVGKEAEDETTARRRARRIVLGDHGDSRKKPG